MSTEYCNLCTHVIAPSESVAAVLRERGVITPITSIPSGVDPDFYGQGDGNRFRGRFKIRDDATVIGHVGRLAPEKNLDYLAEAVGRYLHGHPQAVFLVVGSGDASESMQGVLRDYADASQVFFADKQTGQDLADAYAAMDVFVFSSQSETQGMVLAEAMAAGVPAVALDAPGAREIVSERNGILLDAAASPQEFAEAIATVADDGALRERMSQSAKQTAGEFSLQNCADQMLALYERLAADRSRGSEWDVGPWDRLLGRLEIEWNLLIEKTTALAAAAAIETDATKAAQTANQPTS
jgi:1,2-diacylglycerol 3-alpha-glucosyltransferase